MAWYDNKRVWYGIDWYGMAWYGMEPKGKGVVWYGNGLAQYGFCGSGRSTCVGEDKQQRKDL